MKKTLQLTCLLLYASSHAFATVKSDHPKLLTPLMNIPGFSAADEVKGTVRDATGTTLPGVSVQVKGTKLVTQTNASGQYGITAKAGDIIVFSYIGYDKQEITVGTQATVDIVLKSSAQELNTVVVTALGVKKSEKSLTYATQQISNKDLTTVKSDNLMNSLNGKIAGVTISPSASGVGGSAKVVLRGNRSIAGNNQPLYVIDGVPMSNSANSNSQPTNTMGGNTNVDGGDGISNLNPDDIESMSVLKGASASALYGSDAANGVIIITTKKGKAGKAIINYSSSLQVDNAAFKPEFQNNYGQSSAGSTDSYGPKISGGSQDNLKQFFQTGTNFTNSINLSGGSENAQTYVSYANTAARGIQPGNKLSRHNFNLRETARFLDNKLTVDGNINYIAQKIDNTPGLGLYFNPLTGLYLFPRGNDITPYKNQYELGDQQGYNRQNWFVLKNDVQQNPWWVTNRNLNFSNRNRILLNGSVKYEVNSWLNLQVRGNLDRTTDSYEQDLYSGTTGVLSKENGQMILNNQTVEQKYGDFLATFTAPAMGDFKLDGILGTSIKDIRTTGVTIGAGQGLNTPNLFITQNTVLNSTVSNAKTLPANGNQLQSIFGNANLSYKDWAFLTVTGRNDWSSNLAFTPNGSYFYPSVGLSFILNQMFHLPEVISYAKVRGSYAEVGNSVPQYVTNPVNYTDDSGSIVVSTVAPFPKLKPEKTKSWEFGADMRFFENKLSLSFSYYKSNTYNQFIQIAPSVATGYSIGYVNAGNVQNTGFEFMLGYNAIKTSDFEWNTSFNGSRNKNVIIDVASKEGINEFIMTGNYNNGYESHITTGGSYGDIYGKTLKYDAQGRILIGSNGTPITNNDFSYVGNSNPKFQLGWSNNFSYKNFNLNLLVDGKFGGQVMSITQAMLDEYGVSKVSGEARDRGFVEINGVDPNGNAVTQIDPKLWYKTIGGRSGVTGQYMYSATVVRLREASLGYTFPIKDKFVKNLKLAVTGRNLLYFYKKAPYDPELTLSTGNGLSGVDVFNQPAIRSLGFNLNVTF
ncbi:SusC/RagA family TonB-linked outer membrane protein [Pedobacter cryoconitis]|uniref:TonB-linked SusC/RagA family outer membrane protein n=1 Tax=Pedobacter cryoconitis TaxID=188932 RepID=A0A327SKH0_9SPHI|nr:SusC/RagA family TonB-linked outer membrane protein [Pedobacter cryoconitis]RAJ29706.1 TonB-linked SusC/RagA family outer membrane protein [Pedobacter cryoconitis]